MRVRPQLWLLLSALAVLVTWMYMHRVLLPWEHYFNVEAGPLKTALGDLYSPWFGSRALIQEGKNPYGPEVTHEIQSAFYGRDIAPVDGLGSRVPASRTIDEQRFAYPVYVAFLLAPTTRMSFEKVDTYAPFVLVVAVAGSVLLWMSFLRWHPSAMTAAAVTLFMLASPQIAQGLRIRQLGLLVGAMIALAAWLLCRDRLWAAGAMLALSTIKPQMSILAIAYVVLWSSADLARRWRLLASLCGTFCLLAGAGELILPGWPRDFLRGLVAYTRYNVLRTLLQVALGKTLGMAVGIALLAGLLVWGWMNRKLPADSSAFAYAMSIFLVLTTLVFPLIPPFNQVLLMLPTQMILRDWPRLPRTARAAFTACVSWPGITSLVMLASPPSTKSLAPLALLPIAPVVIFPVLLWVLLVANRHSISGVESAAKPA
jgi:uncharacterized membrane protein